MMVSELNPSLNKPKVYKIKRIKCKVVKKPAEFQIGGIEFERDSQVPEYIHSTFVPETYQDMLDKNSWNENFNMMSNFVNLFEHTYENCKFKMLFINCDKKSHSGAYYRFPTTPGNGEYFTKEDLSIAYDDFDIHQIPECKTYDGNIHMSVILMYSNIRNRYVCICIPYIKEPDDYIAVKANEKIDTEHQKAIINDMIEKINEFFSKAYCMVFFSLTKK